MAKDILYPLRVFHGWMHEYPIYLRERNEIVRSYVKPIKKQIKKNPNIVFLVMTPEQGNLGDHAIALSECIFFDQIGIDYIEISFNTIFKLFRYGLLNIMNGHLICVSGGGNLGTLWYDVEKMLRVIITKQHSSKIIQFPNTIFYENSVWGQNELHKSIQIYNRHKYLTIYAREEVSYNYMKPIYKDVRLMPDMVMSLKQDFRNIKRTGCLLCLRNDCEKTRTKEQERIIRLQAQLIFGEEVCDTDTVVPYRVTKENREYELNKKFTEFAKAELVITDRLHGMIFCAITGTPCIVINSKSPKVRGCYNWIAYLDYVRFVDDVSQIVEEYKKIPDRLHYYDNVPLRSYYKELAKVVKEYVYN